VHFVLVLLVIVVDVERERGATTIQAGRVAADDEGGRGTVRGGVIHS